MGVIRIWSVVKDHESWKITIEKELAIHQGRINDIFYGNGQLWTGMLSFNRRPVNN